MEGTRLAPVVAAPAVLLAVVSVGLIGLGAVGTNPFWPPTALTFAEAAALRDRATVVRLLEQGADPLTPYPIRAGLISGEDLSLTPVAAAIRENRGEIVAVLLDRIPRERLVPHVCGWLAQAVARRSDTIPAMIETRFPLESAACDRRP